MALSYVIMLAGFGRGNCLPLRRIKKWGCVPNKILPNKILLQTIEAINTSGKFPPIMRCIYCGDTKGPFSDEHIIPYGLQGAMIIQKASCANCAKITGRFEQRVLRDMLGATRIHLGLQTRRPKERPKKLDVFVKSNNGVKHKKVPIQDHPHMLIMPELPPPIVLKRTGGLKQGQLRLCLYVLNGVSESTACLGRKLSIKQTFSSNDFYQLIAKIAHSYVTATLGVDSFEPALVDFILGNKQNASEFIGGPDETTEFSRDKSQLHQIILSYYYNRSNMSLPPIIIADICLFSCFGMPIYQAVVGRSKAAQVG